METIGSLMQGLNAYLQDPELVRLGVAVLMGLAIFTLLLALMLVVKGLFDPVRQRLRHLEVNAAGATSGTGTAGMDQWLGPLGERLAPDKAETRSRLARELSYAGKRSPSASSVFHGVRLMLAVLPATLMLLAFPLLRIPPAIGISLVASLAIAGYLLPRFWLERAIKRRTTLLRRGLPDALDLLVVCSEAGLGLVAAIQRVARDLEVSHPELADELHLFGMQTRAGMDNRSALRDLEERTGVEDIRGLVTTLLQSMRFGTSIAQTLRLYAEELRDKRTQEAEEKAAKVSTKMLFPLIFCIFPSFFVVAMGPPLLGAMRALSAAGH